MGYNYLLHFLIICLKFFDNTQIILFTFINALFVFSMAVALYWSLRKNEKITNKKFADIFSERKFPLVRYSH